jgi:hypothetical protein
LLDKIALYLINKDKKNRKCSMQGVAAQPLEMSIPISDVINCDTLESSPSALTIFFFYVVFCSAQPTMHEVFFSSYVMGKLEKGKIIMKTRRSSF